MAQNNIENSLSRITADILALPHYNSNFSFANIASQIQAVDSRLKALLELKFVVKQPIKDNYNVIPRDVSSTRDLSNFGQAASDCLSLLASPHEGQNISIPLVVSFLEAVKLQAQEACDKIAEANYKRDAQAREEYDKRFQEYVDDFELRREKLERQLLNTQLEVDALKKLAETVSDSVKAANESATAAKQEAERAQNAAKAANTESGEAKKQVGEAKNIANGMIPNMLTVLGIFVGVIVAVVACYLTILLTKNESEVISAVSIPLGFLFAWMMGHILIMAVFLLLYLTAKLTDRTLACHCKYYRTMQPPEEQDYKPDASTTKIGTMPECIQCKNSCRSLIRMKFRFPYLFWINTVFVVGYVLLGVVHLTDLYYAEHLNRIIQSNWVALTLFAIIVLAAIGTVAMIAIKIIKHASPKPNTK